MDTMTIERMSTAPLLIDTAPVGYLKTITMTPEEWAGVQDNPRQRDTERRAAKADHLKTEHPIHSHVSMAVCNRHWFKLDGHTRSYLWSKGIVAAPVKLTVAVWRCDTIEDVKALYETFDSRAAVETTTDQLFGAAREHDSVFHSEVLRMHRYTAALRAAHAMLFGWQEMKATSLYDIYTAWLPELVLLDQCDPKRKRFHTGVIAGALITFRRYGAEAKVFWTKFSTGDGWKMDGQRDAVQALEERMETRRRGKGLSGSATTDTITRLCLSAFDAYRRDHIYANSPGNAIKTIGDATLTRWVEAAKRKRPLKVK